MDIEKGFSVPTLKKHDKLKTIADSMCVNDSILLEYTEALKLSRIIRKCGNSCSMRKEDVGYRVWKRKRRWTKR